MKVFSNSKLNIIAAYICIVIIAAFSITLGSDTEDDLFGTIPAEDYLRGKFIPSTHPFFIELSTLGIPCDRFHYLRKEAALALSRMYAAMKKELPEVTFWVQSSTRNWDTQKAIWERRWREHASGKKKYTDRSIARAILRSSSMPGTSRHHWGTDFDINILQNDYYKKGNGAKLYSWLQNRAGDFGFCQPYIAARRAGYMEERWHWSYMPLASEFQKRWNALFGKNPAAIVKDGGFIGHKSVIADAPVYVNSINESCKKREITE